MPEPREPATQPMEFDKYFFIVLNDEKVKRNVLYSEYSVGKQELQGEYSSEWRIEAFGIRTSIDGVQSARQVATFYGTKDASFDQVLQKILVRMGLVSEVLA